MSTRAAGPPVVSEQPLDNTTIKNSAAAPIACRIASPSLLLMNTMVCGNAEHVAREREAGGDGSADVGEMRRCQGRRAKLVPIAAEQHLRGARDGGDGAER